MWIQKTTFTKFKEIEGTILLNDDAATESVCLSARLFLKDLITRTRFLNCTIELLSVEECDATKVERWYTASYIKIITFIISNKAVCIVELGKKISQSATFSIRVSLPSLLIPSTITRKALLTSLL